MLISVCGCDLYVNLISWFRPVLCCKVQARRTDVVAYVKVSRVLIQTWDQHIKLPSHLHNKQPVWKINKKVTHTHNGSVWSRNRYFIALSLSDWNLLHPQNSELDTLETNIAAMTTWVKSKQHRGGNGTASTRGTHQLMAATGLVTCQIFDTKPHNQQHDCLKYLNQIGLMMSCPGREQVTDRMADEACKRGRLHRAV